MTPCKAQGSFNPIYLNIRNFAGVSLVRIYVVGMTVCWEKMCERENACDREDLRESMGKKWVLSGINV